MAGWVDGWGRWRKKEKRKKRREGEKERRKKERKKLLVWWQEKCECCIVLLRFMYLLWFKAGEYGCLVKVSRGEPQLFSDEDVLQRYLFGESQRSMVRV